MKRFDFSKTGGFPLSQDRLAWMQEGYINAINALGSISGATQTVVLSGVQATFSGSGIFKSVTVTNGWIYDPAMGVMPFVGGNWNNAALLGLTIYDLKTPLTFKNNASQLVQIERYATFSAQMAQQGGSAMSVSALTQSRWYKEFGKQGRDQSWTQLQTAMSGHSFNLYLKKDSISNLLKLRGEVQVAANLSLPYTYAVFQTPAQFIPASDMVFSGAVRYVNNAYPVNSVTGQRIKSMNGRIDALNASANFIKFELEPCASSYTAHFNCVLNID